MAEAFPPHPSVEHLPTIFRRIEGRNLLIPAFQRTFVWKQSQVLALLESVYHGFPIGSILLWRVDEPILKISDMPELPFPRGAAKFPANFVLDGVQRLSSLYGVFNFGSVTKSELFNVSFDLTSETFGYDADFPNQDKEIVPLNALFNPRALLSVQQTLLSSTQGDQLVHALLTLQSRFQEYMIPLVTLAHREPAEVVSIFERVNSTGTRLSTVDFMRAITWSEDFDLNDALEEIHDKLDSINLDFSDDTIIKALGLVFALDPLPNIMLRLREKTAAQLKSAIKSTKATFLRVNDFLRDSLLVYGSDFVPYEGQLLVLFNVFAKHRKLSIEQKAQLKAWFFSVSFSEALQGRPDNYVARMIRNIASNIQSGSIEIHRPTMNLLGLLDRRMIRGKALSTAFVSLLGHCEARSIVSGAKIPLEEYLSVYDNANFWPIFAGDELPPRLGQTQVSAKMISNVVLVPPSDHAVARERGVKAILADLYERNDDSTKSILKSQLLPIGQANKLGAPRAMEFLTHRTNAVDRALERLVNPRTTFLPLV
jgi:hypothetical protein